ncbi:N-6 DNA methylase [Acidimicrobiaceae bacterium]|nr:N-6 DNA methylase [Acidimicrobiaceae bacterium]
MLDQETKKKINDLRDTLVGKVPDPKSQVEQIMIALIYKFMNDMDKESNDLGGESSFFVGDFEKYSWDNLFGTKVSGSELVDLYSTAVESMEENPNIPQLFRDVFKNAYIPYKDAETLRLFLSQIDDFEYSKDSEQLGDAFEHILSSLSSQGDAGQFRTPRHIIDFIVEIVDPKKDETVLDPASGTSGFLISAFKHIVNSNSEKSSGDLLSAAERKKIMENINGYDISPDMVRIGLANMYLHGFPEPNVVEYDALTSEDRWNEYYDVILANPPFMTPKGGIRPHNKFGVKSNKAEVLFVDYILTHLKPKGRAGIIVPEGIIFQSGKAYKELRKKLVENGLVGVISLPSGVFNPYSGVKTSILIIDKTKNANDLFYADIQNDGYSLGAQRNPIELNDLPSVLKEIRSSSTSNTVKWLKKELLDEVYSLNFIAYKVDKVESDYPIKALKDICEITMGQSPKSEFYNENGEGLEFHQGKANFGNIHLKPSGVWTSQYNKVAEENSILMSVRAPVGPVNITDREIALGRGLCGIKSNADCDQMYLFYLLKSSKDKLTKSSHGSTFDSINRTQLLDFEIPLPPLEKQQEIVDEIEQYQKVIDGAKQVVENHTISIDTDFEENLVLLGDICDVRDGTHDSPKYIESDEYPLVTSKNLKNGFVDLNDVNYISKKDYDDINKRSLVEESDILMPMIGSIGNPVIVESKPKFAIKNVALIKVSNSKILPHFVLLLLSSNIFKKYLLNNSQGSTQKFISLKLLRSFEFDLPSIEIQEKLVQEYLLEKNTIKNNIDLIENYENKINSIINKLYK